MASISESKARMPSRPKKKARKRKEGEAPNGKRMSH
jgi:hypothetical protein